MPTSLLTILIVSIILLGGCSSQENIPENAVPDHISSAAKQHIKSTLVVVSVDEDSRLGMPVSGQGTSHQYYGVIGKLAESGEVRYQKDLSDDYRQLLRGIDKVAFKLNIGSLFRETAGEALRSIDWLNMTSVVSQTDIPVADVAQLVQTQDEDALLLIDNRYLMAIDFSSITVLSYVTLYAHNESLVKIAKTASPYEDPPILYQKLFTFEYPYEGEITTPDEALKGWNKNDGDMVQRAISQSIDDLTNQIASGLISAASN